MSQLVSAISIPSVATLGSGGAVISFLAFFFLARLTKQLRRLDFPTLANVILIRK